MAKIYETEKDFERDKLAEQAGRMHHYAHAQEKAGWTMFIGSMFANMFSGGRWGRLFDIAGVALGVGAVIQWVKSWRTGGKAHDLELARERLGPGLVVLPPEERAPEKECTDCRLKKPRTLLDYAQKTAGESDTINR